MSVTRLTAAQAMVRYIVNQLNGDGDMFIAGCWAIFGHGNVAALGEALHVRAIGFRRTVAITSRRWRMRRSLTQSSSGEVAR